MKLESRFRQLRNEVLLGTALLSAATPVVVPPFVNWQTTRGVVTGDVDCSSGPNGTLAGKPYGVLAIATSGSRWSPEKELIPDAATVRRIKAGAYWYIDEVRINHQRPTVFFLDGNVPRANRDVNRNTFRDYVAWESKNTVTVPVADTFVIGAGINTSETVDAFAKIFHAMNLGKAALFSDKSHVKRFGLLSCADNVPSSVLAAEGVIAAHDPSQTPIMQALDDSPAMKQTEIFETLKNATLPWFKHGEVLTVLKNMRNVWHDLPLYRLLKGYGIKIF